MTDDVVIHRVTRDAIPRFEPLWLELRAHHGGLEPDMPMQPEDRSWSLRRAVYERFFDRPGTFGLLAERDGVDIGYAVVVLHDGPDDTWITGDRTAEVESLCVAADARGSGVGGLLLDRVDVELERIGVRDLQIAVVAANEDALRFYERRGLRRRLVMLSTFGFRED